MNNTTLTYHLAFFAIVPLLLNVVSVVPVLVRIKHVSALPILCLLLFDCTLSLLLTVPLYAVSTGERVFTDVGCALAGSFDMSFSLIQVSVVCLIAFDRYIATIQPKWGSFRSHCAYMRILLMSVVVCVLWSTLPILGYGRYSVFDNGTVCSLDWTLGELASTPKTGNATIDKLNDSVSTGYIALLTVTFLLFFLIPVCVASSLYYSISDHVEKIASSEVREDPTAPPTEICTWAPGNHVAKVGLGCVIVSTVPYLAYAFVCLNPTDSGDRTEMLRARSAPSLLTPMLVSRLSTLLNPIFYVWLNPQIFDIENRILKKFRRPPPPPKAYQTINLIADIPCMSILTPTVPRRQLPQIPPHLLSPSQSPRHTMILPEERPLLS